MATLAVTAIEGNGHSAPAAHLPDLPLELAPQSSRNFAHICAKRKVAFVEPPAFSGWVAR
jgi:hypothetical protein